LKFPPDILLNKYITKANVNPITQALPVTIITNKKIYVPKILLQTYLTYIILYLLNKN
jgi:hypothetical protein